MTEPPSPESCKETNYCHVLACSVPLAGSQRERLHRAVKGDWEGFSEGFCYFAVVKLGLSSFG